jgi:hypothetical protein
LGAATAIYRKDSMDDERNGREFFLPQRFAAIVADFYDLVDSEGRRELHKITLQMVDDLYVALHEGAE